MGLLDGFLRWLGIGLGSEHGSQGVLVMMTKRVVVYIGGGVALLKWLFRRVGCPQACMGVCSYKDSHGHIA